MNPFYSMSTDDKYEKVQHVLFRHAYAGIQDGTQRLRCDGCITVLPIEVLYYQY